MTSAQPIRAILLCNLALLLFAAMDTTTKYLTASFDVPLIVAARFIGNLSLMLVFLVPRGRSEMLRTQRTGLVWIRGACLAGSSILVALALQRMPVAETTALVFVAPTLAVLAAGPLLHEKIGFWGWGAVLVGLAGVMLIARPGAGLDFGGVLLGLAAALLVCAYQLLSRLLASSERTFALLFYSAVVGTVVFGAALPWYVAGQSPTALEACLLAALGMLGGLGHYLFTAAFRYAPVSLLAPMTYLQLLWAALLGWLVFGHVPDFISILGMVTIGASGAMVALRSRRRVSTPAT